MSAIPEAVFEAVEKKLRQRDRMAEKALEALARARAKATDVSAPIGAGGHGKGPPGSRTERGAMIILQAEKRLRKAMKWEKVFRKMDDIYPKDSGEGIIAELIYQKRMSQAEAARACGISRQAVKQRQDRYVTRCAFLAAQAGLIREGGVKANGDADQEN